MEGIVSVLSQTLILTRNYLFYFYFFAAVAVVGHQRAVTHRFATRVLNSHQAVFTYPVV